MDEKFQISLRTSIIPGALIDKEKTLITFKQSRSAKLIKSFISDLEKEEVKNEQLYQQLKDQIRLLQEELKQLRSDIEQVKKDVYEKDLEENMIRNNIITQKQNLSRLKEQTQDGKELSKLMEKVCSLRSGIEKKKNALKNEMDKFKVGIMFYQKYLNCKITLVSKDTVMITFDSSLKSVSEAREYLKFSIHDHCTTFQFLEMHPKLKNEQQLVKTYNETGDIQGFIASFCNLIKRINSRKVLSEKN